MKKYLVFLTSMLILTACNDDFELQGEESSKLVVEGWIEDGGFPIVMLTRSLPVSTEYRNIDDLSDYILRWAKVTVSDGTDSVVLTGKYDEGYLPPYIYTTSRLRGKAGRQYSLTVEYKNYHATSKTTIPHVPTYCAFSVERTKGSDTLFQIKAKFKDNPTEKNYYQFFTRVGTKSKQYLASYLGTLDDNVLNNETEIPIYRGHQLQLDQYTPYFALTDTVSVKFAHIDETSFRIWDSYIKILSLSSNMFLSTSTDIETNINGGYGYWCGYGTITNYIVIQDSINNGK
jgi:hypothetical protein